MRDPRIFLAAAVGAAFIALAASGDCCAASATEAAPTAPAPSAGDGARAVEQAIQRAAERVGPAVVNLGVVREMAAGTGGIEGEGVPDWLPDELRERMREYFDELRRRGGRQPLHTQGNGSGCIISGDGFILTSEHVVRDATEIIVTLAGGKHHRARVVGTDPRRDLAVIRIEATGLPVAELGDASALARGQFVIALGSPFGFGRDGQASLSFGIVSATGRAIPGIGAELDRYYGNLIQTDAAINPGNSGGPLVDLEGRVVGVNAVISSRGGTSEGVGFAVPINEQTRAIIERLKRGEEIVYGFLGVEIGDVTEVEAEEFKAEAGRGAVVSSVLADTPADKAGLKQGDIILAIGKETIRGPDDVIQIIQATPVGESVDLDVLRDGKHETMRTAVARRPAPKALAVGTQGDLWWRGMHLEPLTEELRKQTGLEAAQQGVFVREVRNASPAAEAGIVPGMVVDQVGDRTIASVAEFATATGEAEGPLFVHIVGIGVKVIQGTGGARHDGAPAPESATPTAPSSSSTSSADRFAPQP
jgi:serine protease Do